MWPRVLEPPMIQEMCKPFQAHIQALSWTAKLGSQLKPGVQEPQSHWLKINFTYSRIHMWGVLLLNEPATK